MSITLDVSQILSIQIKYRKKIALDLIKDQKNEASLSKLCELVLRDSSPEIRRMICQSLGKDVEIDFDLPVFVLNQVLNREDDAKTRREAILALGRIHDTKSAKIAAKILAKSQQHDSDKIVRKMAEKILENIAHILNYDLVNTLLIDIFIEDLKNPNLTEMDKIDACKGLGEIGNLLAIFEILKFMHSLKEDSLKNNVLEILKIVAQNSKYKNVDDLIAESCRNQLNSPQRIDIRIIITEILSSITLYSKAFDILAELAIMDPEAIVRQQALRNLASSPSKERIHYLLQVIKTDGSPENRTTSLELLIHYDLLDETHKELVKIFDKETNPIVRAKIIEALGSFGHKNSFQILIKGLKDSSSQVRQASAISLSKLGYKKGLTALTLAIQIEKDSDTRAYFVKALGEMGFEEAVPILLDILQRDVSANVRADAITSLCKLDIESSSELIIDKFEHDPAPQVRISAVQAMINFEKINERIIDLLSRSFYLESDEKVKFEISKTIERLKTKYQAVIEIASLKNQLLIAEDEDIRLSAIRRADITLNPDLRDILYQVLENDIAHPQIRAEVITKLATEHDIGFENIIFKYLDEAENKLVRLSALKALEILKPKSAIEPLLKIINTETKDIAIKVNAIEVIGKIGSYAVSETLIRHFMSDPNPQVRIAILSAFKFIRDINIIPSLINTIQYDESEEVRLLSASVLGIIGDERQLTDLFVTAKYDSSFNVRFEAQNAALELASRCNIQDIDLIYYKLLADLDPRGNEIDRRGATIGMGGIGGSRVIKELTRIIKIDTDPLTRAYAAQSLGLIGNPDVTLQSLIEALEDDNEIVQEYVIAAIGKLGDQRAIPALLPFLTDKFPRVKSFQEVLFTTLRNLGSPQLIPYLGRFLSNDFDNFVQQQVIIALYATKSPEALPLLLKLLVSATNTDTLKFALAAIETLSNSSNIWQNIYEISEYGFEEIRVYAKEILAKVENKYTITAKEKEFWKLITQLRKGEVRERRLSALALGTIERPEALDYILHALRDDNDEVVRANAALSAGILGNKTTLGILIEVKKTVSELVQKSADKALKELEKRVGINESEIKFQRLLLDLRSKEDSVRQHAVEEIGTLGVPEAMSALFQLAQTDLNNSIRLSASKYFIKNSTIQQIKNFIPVIEAEKDPIVLGAQLQSLMETEYSEQHISFFEQFLYHSSSEVRIAVTQGYSMVKSTILYPTITQRVLKLLETEQEHVVKLTIIQTLSLVGTTEAIDPLIALSLKNNDVDLSSSAINALEVLTNRNIITRDILELKKSKMLLSNKDASNAEKFASLEYLNKNWDWESYQVVEKLLDDPSPEIRIRCLEILSTTADLRALRAIRQITIEDKDVNVRKYAYESLLELPIAQQCVDLLNNGLHDSDIQVRTAVIKTMDKYPLETTYYLCDHLKLEDNENIRKIIVESLADEKNDIILNTLIWVAHFDANETVREAALNSFQEACSNRNFNWRELELKLLEEHLWTEDTQIKILLLERLSEIGHLSTVYSLLTLRKIEKNTIIINKILEVLAKLATRLGYQNLEAMNFVLFLSGLNSNDENNRKEALSILPEVGNEKKNEIIIALEEYLKTEKILSLKIKSAKLLADLKSTKSIPLIVQFAISQPDPKLRKGLIALGAFISIDLILQELVTIIEFGERVSNEIFSNVIEAIGWIHTTEAIEFLVNQLKTASNIKITNKIIETLANMNSILAVPILRNIALNVSFNANIVTKAEDSLAKIAKDTKFRNVEEMYAAIALEITDGQELETKGINVILNRISIAKIYFTNLLKTIDELKSIIESISDVHSLWDIQDRLQYLTQAVNRENAIEIHLSTGLKEFIKQKVEKSKIEKELRELTNIRAKAQQLLAILRKILQTKEEELEFASSEEKVLLAIKFLGKKYGRKMTYESIKLHLEHNGIILDYSTLDTMISDLLFNDKIIGRVDTQNTADIDDDVLILGEDTSLEDVKVLSLVHEFVIEESSKLVNKIDELKDQNKQILTISTEILGLSKEIKQQLDDMESNLLQTSKSLITSLEIQYTQFQQLNDLRKQLSQSTDNDKITSLTVEIQKLTLKYEEDQTRLQKQLDTFDEQIKAYFNSINLILPVPTYITISGRLKKTLKMDFSCAREPEDILATVVDSMYNKWLKLSFMAMKTLGKLTIGQLSLKNLKELGNEFKDLWQSYSTMTSPQEFELGFIAGINSDKGMPDFAIIPQTQVLTSQERDQMVVRLREAGFYNRGIYCTECKSWVCNDQHWDPISKMCTDCTKNTSRKLAKQISKDI